MKVRSADFFDLCGGYLTQVRLLIHGLSGQGDLKYYD